jgi:ferrochelatase
MYGVLLINTGTPDSPAVGDVRAYLTRFLSDRRIVNLPPLLWKPILHGIVLRARPRKTVRIYQHIWTPEGSPYQLFSNSIEQKLQLALDAGQGQGPQPGSERLLVRMAHTYGNPSVGAALAEFKALGIEQLLVLPLYPQQSKAPTGGAVDELLRQFDALGYQPAYHVVEDYYRSPAYLDAIATSVRQAAASSAQLIFSFHSIPLKDERNGDPYREQVQWTARQVAQRLGLADESWQVAYQSRFEDAQRWAGPFLPQACDRLLADGCRDIAIICPGFAVDCTETLYDLEVKMRGRVDQLARAHGLLPAAAAQVLPGPGEYRFTYIPALNDTPEQIHLLEQVILQHLPAVAG